MQEKVLKNKKIGMLVLLLNILLSVATTVGMIFGGILLEEGKSPLLFIASIVLFTVSMILYAGLKVLKPQEALVLTLFGKYVGTLKGDGFFFVNPFCSAINPAAKTKLNQSGDVTTKPLGAAANGTAEVVNNKISLKIMTLNNNRQKINDCLGNPVEIGIAVIWRVVDTA